MYHVTVLVLAYQQRNGINEMTILKRLIKRINNNIDEVITVRKVTSGHSKGLTGIYQNKTRIFVSKDRKDIIIRLNELYTWAIAYSQNS